MAVKRLNGNLQEHMKKTPFLPLSNWQEIDLCNKEVEAKSISFTIR